MAAHKVLSQIRLIYTDLDGTLLAPGGRALVNNAGTPSTALAEALVALAEAKVTVVPVSGRNRNQLTEICRLFDFYGFIGELGSVLANGQGAGLTYEYLVGDWQDIPKLVQKIEGGKTPYRIIEESGIIDKLLRAFPGRLEYHLPWAATRETTHVFRGNIDLARARKIIDDASLPLTILDNGILHPRNHTLEIDEPIHGYHVLPPGITKAAALRLDMGRRGLAKHEVVGIGDSMADIVMGEETGTLVMLSNSLKDERVVAAIEDRIRSGQPTFVTQDFTCDGWVEFAKAVLEAKQGPTHLKS